jgi:hypothetical protein
MSSSGGPFERERKKVLHFTGVEAFPFGENLMKIFPGQHPKGSKERIFHYRICRAGGVVENVFGLASSIF